MTKYLLFVSCLFFGLGESSRVGTGRDQLSNECFKSCIPKFSSALYAAGIDVVGHHISGLLFLKVMPDSSQRAVFSNEAGITYFDFEWKKNGEFKTHQVIRKLKKRVVINTVRKDFELMLMPGSIVKSVQKQEEEGKYLVIRKKEKVLFKTDQSCQSIISVDVVGKRHRLVEAKFFPEGKNIPDSVSIVHHNFSMKIALKKIER